MNENESLYFSVAEISKACKNSFVDMREFIFYISDFTTVMDWTLYGCRLEVLSVKHENFLLAKINQFANCRGTLKGWIGELLSGDNLYKKYDMASRNVGVITKLLYEFKNDYPELQELFSYADMQNKQLSPDNFQKVGKRILKALRSANSIHSGILQPQNRKPEDYDDLTVDAGEWENVFNAVENISPDDYNCRVIVLHGRILCISGELVLWELFFDVCEDNVWLCGIKHIRELELLSFSMNLHFENNEYTIEKADSGIMGSPAEKEFVEELLNKFTMLMPYMNYQMLMKAVQRGDNGLCFGGSIELSDSHKASMWGVHGYYRYRYGRLEYVRPHTRGHGEFSKKSITVSKENEESTF